MSDSIIEIRDLHKAYGRHNDKPVLKGVDLSLPRGAVMGLIGANGEGKSTLIKCLLGLLRPTSGTCRVLGDDSWELSEQSKSRIGYAPQEPLLLPWMTVRQTISYTRAFYANWDEAFAADLARRWELPMDDRVGVLSLGQKQKSALVLALSHRPELLVLDEPVASLDPIARRQFLDILIEVAQENRCSVLFSTHITSDLERIATHLAMLKRGRILLCDELDALKDRVKRLRISASQDLPAQLKIDGTLRSRVEGREALVAVSSLDDRMVDRLREQWDADVSVEDLNLEEIFVELHNA